jgi:predicted esterase
VHDSFIVSNGEKKNYVWHDIYWAGHRAEPGRSMRLVNASRDGEVSIVLGASSDCLTGMASYTRLDFGEGSTDGCMELRGKTVTIAPHQCWRANAFIALTEGVDSWQRWASAAPKPLSSRVEAAGETGWTDTSLLPILQCWAMPEERERGLAVLSHLDKVPFTSAIRYSATNSFSSFHHDDTGKRAHASVVLLPFRKFESVSVECTGAGGWQASPNICGLVPNQPVTLTLEGPASLEGKERVSVRVFAAGCELAVLRVETDAEVEPRYPFQVKQVSAYLDERWKSEKSGFHGSSADDFKTWRTKTRQYMMKWINDSVTGPVPLSPRIMERQTGPHCVREKILIQTEHDLWIPMYLIRPRKVQPGRKLPAILFPHGSCSGKLLFAPDETADVQDRKLFDQWPSPYQFAHQLGCIVLIPDRRGWGEWSEANHGQRSQRAWNAGYNIAAMDIWDHLRAVDYLAQRPDVDSSRIVSMGSSGGGWMTILLLGADERVAGGIVSSPLITLPSLPEQYFFQREPDKKTAICPPCELPLSLATMLCLGAPRPLWIMDGKDDPCYAMHDKLSLTEEATRAAFARWHAESDAGRNEIARVYRLIGAEDKMQATWFDGVHLAGFTFNNIAGWLSQHFGLFLRSKGELD